jgi:hypothetical protein
MKPIKNKEYVENIIQEKTYTNNIQIYGGV